MTGAEAVVAQLVAEGTDVVLSIPGEHNLPICNALLDHTNIRFVTGRHEQGIGFMANGYARASGRIAVPISIGGPGVTNSLTPLADAYLDSVPMVLVAMHPDPAKLGTGTFHELKDQTGVLASVAKWNTRVQRVEEIPEAVRAAFREAYSGRPGATAVEIPITLQDESAVVDIHPSARPQRQSADPKAVQKAVRLLTHAKSPLAYVGRGAAISGCGDELIKLMELLNIPCFTTALAKGAVPDDHPLNASWGGARHGMVREFMQEADVVLVVGSSLDEADGERLALDFPDQLIQIDTCSEIIGRRYRATAALVGDAREVLRQIIDAVGEPKPARDRHLSEAIAAHRKRKTAALADKAAFQYMAAVQSTLPDDATVTNDASWANDWAISFLERSQPNTFNITRMAAALGYAFPGAVGAKLAYPDRQALALVGDGGFLFTSFAIATAVQHRLNAVAVVFNDNGYSTIKRAQHGAFGRAIGVDLENPDYVRMAESFGARGARAETPDQLHMQLLAAWKRDIPTIIDVPLDENIDYLT